MRNSFSIGDFKYNAILLAIIALSYSTLPSTAYAIVDCSFTGTECNDASTTLQTRIRAQGTGSVLNMTSPDSLDMVNVTNNQAVSAWVGGEIYIFGNTDIDHTLQDQAFPDAYNRSTVYASSSGSTINFKKNLKVVSDGNGIRAETGATINIDGSLTTSTKNTSLTSQRSIWANGSNAQVNINGDVHATGADTNGSAVINAAYGGKVDIKGKSTLINGSAGNSSTVYANQGGSITLADVDIKSNSTATDTAGIFAFGNASININGNTSVKMNSGAAVNAGNSSSISLKNIDINISGNDSNLTVGVIAGENSNITLDQANIYISGPSNNFGLYVEKNGSSIVAENYASINVLGDRSVGAYANTGSITTKQGLSITTNGTNSDGIQVNSGSLMNSEGLDIQVKGTSSLRVANSCGTGAAICLLGDASIFQTSGVGSIDTTGYALQLESGINMQASIADSTIKSYSLDHSLFEINETAGNSKITLNNSMANAGNNNQGSLINVSNNSSLTFEANNSQLIGNILSDASSTLNLILSNSSYLRGNADSIDLSLSNDSQWDITANSTIKNFTNAGIAIFKVSASNTAQKLTVNEYSGGGVLGLNTYLNNGIGSSDILEINTGNSPAGKNYIRILQTDGLAVLPPANGLQVVQAPVGGTQADSFELQGGKIAAGIYEYTLYQNQDGNWYLTAYSNGGGNPSPAPFNQGPDYNGNVSSVVSFASLAQIFNSQSLGTWNERLGSMAYSDPQIIQAIHQRSSPIWVRLEHERGSLDGRQLFKVTDTSGMHSPELKYRSSLLQVGADLLRKPMSNGAYQFAGVSFTTGTIKADVHHFSGIDGINKNKSGTAKIENYSLGGYWTYLTNDRSYVDLVGQYIRHSLDGNGPAGSIKGNGHTLAASVEVGKAFALADANWSLVPQAQLRYQDVKLKNIAARATTSVVGNYQFGDNDSLELRLGLEARYQFTPKSNNTRKQGAWVRIDAMHEFKGTNTVAYTPVNGGEQPIFTSTRRGTSLNLEGGFDIPVSDTSSIYSAAGYRRGLGSNKGHAWKAEVGMRWNF